MDAAAYVKRTARAVFAGIVALALAACAGMQSNTNAGLGDDGSSATTIAAATESAPADAGQAPAGEAGATVAENSSRILLSPGKGGVGLQLVDGDNFNKVIIETPGDPSAQYRVSRLDSPPRLVIDLPGKGSKVSRTFDTADAELISSIRVGAHPDKSRLVLDLLPEGQVEYQIDRITAESGPALALTLTRTGSAADTSMAAIAQDAAVSQAAVPQKEAFASPAAEIVPVADAEKADPSSVRPAQVQALQIQPVGADENMVVLNLSEPKAYDLQKTAPSEYVLKISDAELSPEAAQVLVSPKGSGAIRSVRPVNEDGNVMVRIFSSPESTLSARGSEGRIVIAAGSAEEARAQAKPEQAPVAAEQGTSVAPLETGKANAAEEAGLEPEVEALLGTAPKYTGRLISLDLQDTDIDNALRIIAEVSNLNIIASEDVTGKVTLRLVDVPWDQALDVILKTNGLDQVREGNVIRIAPIEKLRQERENLKQAQQAEYDLEPLQVRYVRVSYSKAAEMKPLVETVLSERGSVAYDERTNQLIIKDIMLGIRNVAELVSKLDLRTPQVLLETQIVEANRTLLRDLGAEVGFTYIRSPATGNALGSNFPNAVAVGGSVDGPGTSAASFPAALGEEGGSAVSFLLDSADATKSLSMRLTALEQEGRVRVISRPAVATTNNKQAVIKSVEKIRIKTPSGGLSVATGQGATASGQSAVATESVEIGIVLEVTPHASPDYFVLLDINAKSSTLGSTVVDGIPSEIERSATSSVLVSSGQTFAMGGIYKITDRDTLSGVPFLKDIPFLGYLFRRQLVNNADEELLFFLTPRIIEGSFDDAAMKVVS